MNSRVETFAPSIRLDLLKWLISPLLIINLVAALVIYSLAWTPVQMAFDQTLIEAAYDLRLHLRSAERDINLDLPTAAEQMLRVNHLDEVFYTVRNNAGEAIGGDKDFPPLHEPAKFNTPLAYDGQFQGEPVRIVVLKTLVGSEPIEIGIAETLTKRRKFRFTILMTLFGLEMVLVLVSMSTVWFAVRESLFPLGNMQTELDSRSPRDLSPVAEKDVPLELRPLIKAINALLQRAQEDGKARHDFLANIAHQLRTPMAGFKAQVELLQQKHEDEPETAHATRLMMFSVERMIRQTNQLLSLARAEPSQFERKPLNLIELDKLVEETIQYFVQEADKKKIDIGFELDRTEVMGDRFLLRDLIENLVDNAIRYTPANGQVTVRCTTTETGGLFAVEDTGPGIPSSDREKIFGRFYRIDDKVAGSGLGLAIVRDIAKDHDATIILESGRDGKGTIFTIKFLAVAHADIG